MPEDTCHTGVVSVMVVEAGNAAQHPKCAGCPTVEN